MVVRSRRRQRFPLPDRRRERLSLLDTWRRRNDPRRRSRVVGRRGTHSSRRVVGVGGPGKRSALRRRGRLDRSGSFLLGRNSSSNPLRQPLPCPEPDGDQLPGPAICAILRLCHLLGPVDPFALVALSLLGWFGPLLGRPGRSVQVLAECTSGGRRRRGCQRRGHPRNRVDRDRVRRGHPGSRRC